MRLHNVRGNVVVVVDTVARVRELLRSAPEYGAQVAEEVASFLMLAADRGRHVETVAGSPQLVEAESLRQSYAGLFHRQSFETAPMLSAAAVVGTLGPVEDTRGFTKRLRATSTVIAVKHGNAFVYPAFQFDAGRHRVRPVVAEVNQALGAGADPWGALAWWAAPNPRWERHRPIDHPDDDRLVALATAEADDGF